jgi:hypothetical protein
MVLVLVIAGVALSGAVAGASVRRENSDFCEAAADVNAQVTDPDNAELTPEDAASAAKGMKHASKFAPKKVKKAMRKLVRTYNRIADGEDISTVFGGEDGLAFIRASGVYSRYYLQQCGDGSGPGTGG